MRPRLFISVVLYSVVITVLFLVYQFWYSQPHTENTVVRLEKAAKTDSYQLKHVIAANNLEINSTFAIRSPYSDLPQCQQSFSSTGEVVASQILNLPAAYQPMLNHSNDFKLKCGTCALVSSSGQLLKSKAGAEIDHADCILRMNSAPSLGFEEDVGQRTTVRVVGFIATRALSGAEARKRLLTGKSRPEYLVFWGLHSDKHDWGLRLATDLAASFNKATRIYQFSELAEKRADKIFEKETGMDRMKSKSWLSTGFFAMLFSLDICDHVTVYGMTYDDYCKKHPNSTHQYHYFQSGLLECNYLMSNEATGKGGHRFMTEKAMFGRWMVYRNITFKYPSWDEADVCGSYETPFMIKKPAPKKSKKSKFIKK